MDENIIISKKVLSGLLEIARVYFSQENIYTKTYLECKWPDEPEGSVKEQHKTKMMERIEAAEKLLAEINRILDQLISEEEDDEQSFDDRTPDE